MPTWCAPLLRSASPEDLERLYDIETECFGERRFRKDHVDWILRNRRGLTLVEDQGGRFLGAAMLLFEGQTCRVLSIAVIPGARRQGIGTAIMRAIREEAERREVGLIRLEVSTQNHGAIRFYRNLGYRTDGVLYGYYSWGEDAFSMILPVAASATPSRRDIN